MFDITAQTVADTAPIHLKGLDGSPLYSDGKPVRIVLPSPGSDVFAEVAERQTARAIKRMNDEGDEKIVQVPKEQRDREQAEDLAALTVAFENFTYPPAGDATGKDLFRAFYADRKLGHLTQQVMKALKDWGKFGKASSGV